MWIRIGDWEWKVGSGFCHSQIEFVIMMIRIRVLNLNEEIEICGWVLRFETGYWNMNGGEDWLL